MAARGEPRQKAGKPTLLMDKNASKTALFSKLLQNKAAKQLVAVGNILYRLAYGDFQSAKTTLTGLAVLASFIYPTNHGVILADFEADLPATASSVSQAGLPRNSQSTAVVAVPQIKISAYTTKRVWLTAYSSSPEETDDTPFITASGKSVRDGVIAANFLPLGTRIRIPDAFGDKIFVVEDRMHPRKKNVVDVWMPSKNQALAFGSKLTEIHVLE